MILFQLVTGARARALLAHRLALMPLGEGLEERLAGFLCVRHAGWLPRSATLAATSLLCVAPAPQASGRGAAWCALCVRPRSARSPSPTFSCGGWRWHLRGQGWMQLQRSGPPLHCVHSADKHQPTAGQWQHTSCPQRPSLAAGAWTKTLRPAPQPPRCWRSFARRSGCMRASASARSRCSAPVACRRCCRRAALPAAASRPPVKRPCPRLSGPQQQQRWRSRQRAAGCSRQRRRRGRSGRQCPARLRLGGRLRCLRGRRHWRSLFLSTRQSRAPRRRPATPPPALLLPPRKTFFPSPPFLVHIPFVLSLLFNRRA